MRIRWPVAGFVPLPLDLFSMADELHEVARRRAVTVPMLDDGDSSVDLAEALRWVVRVVGDDDPRTQRLRSFAA